MRLHGMLLLMSLCHMHSLLLGQYIHSEHSTKQVTVETCDKDACVDVMEDAVEMVPAARLNEAFEKIKEYEHQADRKDELVMDFQRKYKYLQQKLSTMKKKLKKRDDLKNQAVHCKKNQSEKEDETSKLIVENIELKKTFDSIEDELHHTSGRDLSDKIQRLNSDLRICKQDLKEGDHDKELYEEHHKNFVLDLTKMHQEEKACRDNLKVCQDTLNILEAENTLQACAEAGQFFADVKTLVEELRKKEHRLKNKGEKDVFHNELLRQLGKCAFEAGQKEAGAENIEMKEKIRGMMRFCSKMKASYIDCTEENKGLNTQVEKMSMENAELSDELERCMSWADILNQVAGIQMNMGSPLEAQAKS